MTNASFKMPIYAEIARYAEVSAMTVSNVLRGRSGVLPSNREKVYSALKELGVPGDSLLPNRKIQGRKRRARSLLFVESGLCKGAWEAPVYMEILRGAEEKCADAGWSLQVHHARSSAELGAMATGFHGWGVLLFGPEARAQRFLEKDPGLATVRLLGTASHDDPADSVNYDDGMVGTLAAEYLLGKGCRKLGFIGVDHQPRATSFAALAGKHGAEVRLFCDNALYKLERDRQVIDHVILEQLWSQAVDFGAEGLFVHSDQISVALHGMIFRAGRNPGVDLHLISCNCEEPFLSLLHPRPPSVDIHSREMGRRAVETIFWRLENPLASRQILTLAPSLPLPFLGDESSTSS